MDDPIQAYLRQLAIRLRMAPESASSALAEVEAHLRDAERDLAGVAGSRAQAQRAAVARFGSVEQVAAGYNREARRVLVQSAAPVAARCGMRLVAVGAVAVGVAGLVAQVLARLTSVAFVFGPAEPGALPVAGCLHWLAVHPEAGTCAQAATLENSADAVQLYVAGSVAGLLLLAAALVVLRFIWPGFAVGSGRRLGRLAARVEIGCGAVIFAVASLALLAAGALDLQVAGAWGRGLWLTDAVVAATACTGYLLALAFTEYRTRGDAVLERTSSGSASRRA